MTPSAGPSNNSECRASSIPAILCLEIRGKRLSSHEPGRRTRPQTGLPVARNAKPAAFVFSLAHSPYLQTADSFGVFAAFYSQSRIIEDFATACQSGPVHVFCSAAGRFQGKREL